MFWIGLLITVLGIIVFAAGSLISVAEYLLFDKYYRKVSRAYGLTYEEIYLLRRLNDTFLPEVSFNHFADILANAPKSYGRTNSVVRLNDSIKWFYYIRTLFPHHCFVINDSIAYTSRELKRARRKENKARRRIR